MRRRDFLRAASGAAGAGAAGASVASPAAAQESPTPTPGGTATATPSEGGGGATHTVEMTDELVFDPDEITIAPGDTVVWENTGSVGHTVTAYEDEIPEGADYFASGDFDTEDAARGGYPDRGNVAGGESYEHTFETTGEYGYFCIPHEAVGMVGTVVVQEGGAPAEGGEGGGEADPEEMGVPFHAHYVGTATILGIFVSLIFTFYLLKYGETPHSGYPGEGD